MDEIKLPMYRKSQQASLHFIPYTRSSYPGHANAKDADYLGSVRSEAALLTTSQHDVNSVTTRHNSSHEESSEERPAGIFPLVKLYNKSDSVCYESDGIKVKLLNVSLWDQFAKIGTEMIITKKGRRVFPVPTFMVEGLGADKLYNIRIMIHSVDDKVHRYVNGTWMPHRTGNDIGPYASPARNAYLHPSSPNTGDYWMRDPIVFGGLKISNNLSSSGMIVLQSMRKYRMTLELKELGSTTDLSIPLAYTDFVAVTQYQNEIVTKMKIEHNPFANAFRYPNKNKEKRKSMPPAGEESETSSHSQRHTNPDSDVVGSCNSSGSSVSLPTESTHISPFSHRSPSNTGLVSSAQQKPSVPATNHSNNDHNVVKPRQLDLSHLHSDDNMSSRWPSHPSLDYQMAHVLPPYASQISDMNYRAKPSPFGYDITAYSPTPIFQPHVGLYAPSIHPAVPMIGQCDPLNEVRQLREFMNGTINHYESPNALPLVRKRQLNSEHAPESANGRTGSPSHKMAAMTWDVANAQAPVRASDFPEDSQVSRVAHGQQSLECQTPDSYLDPEVSRSPQNGSFAQEEWPEEISEIVEDVAADMTMKGRKMRQSFPEGPPDNSESQEKQAIRRPEVTLRNRDLWCTTNEVVVSAEGRSMFPYISLAVGGLEPRRLYYIGLEMTSSSKWLYNYRGHEWRPCVTSSVEDKVTLYQHPENPKHGHEWTKGVLFDRLRLSTTRQGKNMLKVQLRRQYYPVLIIRTNGHKWRYALKDAMFVTVSIDKTPLLLPQRCLPDDGRDLDIEQGVRLPSHSAQRKQKNPRKMQSSPVSPYTVAMNQSGNTAPYLYADGATSASFAQALQAHDAGLLNEEKSRMYGGLEKSPPTMYSPDIEPGTRIEPSDFHASPSQSQNVNNMDSLSLRNKHGDEGAKDKHDVTGIN